MADYKYLKENNLFEAHMRYMRALGESFAPIEEADDDQNNPQGQQGGVPGQDPMAGGMPGDPMGGGMPPAPDAAGGAPGGDPMAGGMPGPNSGMPDPNGGMPGPSAEGGAPGEDPMAGGMPDPMAGLMLMTLQTHKKRLMIRLIQLVET